MAYRAGVKMRDLDSTQYHPTGAVFPEQNVGLLITEKVRGLGTQLVNAEGEEFCFPLEPRDIETSCIIRECLEIGKGINTPTGRIGVWLDSPMIDLIHGEGAIRKELPAKYIQFKRYNIDISKEPMLIYPTLHYQNGGLSINDKSETSIKGALSRQERLPEGCTEETGSWGIPFWTYWSSEEGQAKTRPNIPRRRPLISRLLLIT